MEWHYSLEVKPVARDVVVDALDDPVLALDTRGRVVDLNTAATALIASLPGQEGSGKWIGRQVGHVLAAWPDLAHLLPAREEIYVSLNVELADGCRYYDCHVLPLSDPHGAPAGQVVVLHDVTDHKEAEAELVRYAEALEAQNRELDAFARTVAHDLQNPLTIIKAYTDLLDQESADMSEHDVRTFLRAIADSTEWMTHIVEELLLLAGVRRMEEVPIGCLDMEPIVYQAVRQLDHLIHHSQAQVTMAEGWPLVMGHAPWVSEVWINYLSNALKYGGRPDLDLPPSVDVGFDPNATASHVRFWVRDRGRGIPLEDQDRLFTEFSRVNGHESGPKGHGLGLSIVQRIVDRLGGQVGVDSCAGEGSTFWFTLPRASITVPSPDPSETTPPPPERPPGTLRAARDHTLQ